MLCRKLLFIVQMFSLSLCYIVSCLVMNSCIVCGLVFGMLFLLSAAISRTNVIIDII